MPSSCLALFAFLSVRPLSAATDSGRNAKTVTARNGFSKIRLPPRSSPPATASADSTDVISLIRGVKDFSFLSYSHSAPNTVIMTAVCMYVPPDVSTDASAPHQRQHRRQKCAREHGEIRLSERDKQAERQYAHAAFQIAQSEYYGTAEYYPARRSAFQSRHCGTLCFVHFSNILSCYTSVIFIRRGGSFRAEWQSGTHARRLLHVRHGVYGELNYTTRGVRQTSKREKNMLFFWNVTELLATLCQASANKVSERQRSVGNGMLTIMK